ncbi:MAG: leucine-rich repeat domain-containing protein [Candidatus Thorarchaeota archaeon]
MITVRYQGIEYTAEQTRLVTFDGKEVTAPSGPLILNLGAIGLERITDIEGLDQITNSELDHLWLSDNQIQRIEALDDFDKLKMLDLSRNNLTEISEIDGLESLEELWLTGNKITRISGLNNLVSLKEPYIESNLITKIEGLDGLRNLEVLQIYSNNISKIEGIGHLSKLRVLDMSWTKITRIIGLEQLSSLEHLLLQGCEISHPANWMDWCTELNIDKTPSKVGNAQGAVQYCKNNL